MNQYITSPTLNPVYSTSSQVNASKDSALVGCLVPPQTVNLTDTVKHLEQQILLIGPGPHTPSKQSELTRYNFMLQKAKMDLQKQQQAGAKPSYNLISTPNSGASSSPISSKPLTHLQLPSANSDSASSSERCVLDRTRLQELVKEVDPLEQLEDDVEEVLLQIADDFIESVVTNSCHLARHRKSNTLEVKDVKLHLEHCWNMVIPGYGMEDVRTYKKACITEAHKQRMSLIRKTLKKY